MQNFVNYDISVPNYLSNCVAKIGQQWKISLPTHSLHFLLYFEAQVSAAGPPAFACVHLSTHLLRSFLPFAHPRAHLRPRHHDRARPPRRRSYSLREASLWASGMPLGGQVAVWPRCSLPPAACAVHICFPRLSLFVRCLATVPRRSIYTQFRRLTAEPVMGKR